MADLEQIKFDEHGLVPAVIQDWRDGSVLMVGFMNREALEQTWRKKSVHFWSRSRQKLWEKGETSGNRLLVKTVFVDCDHERPHLPYWRADLFLYPCRRAGDH